MKRMRYRQPKWLALVAVTCGTAFQFSVCREESALFGLRFLFSSFTLPINQVIRDFLLLLQT